MAGFLPSGSEGTLRAPPPRPYQVAALHAVQSEFAAGHRSTLVVMATGLGKTVLFSELARIATSHGKRTLVMAHREELVDQAVSKLAAVGIRAGVEMGARRSRTEPVVVASPATLKGARLRAFAADAFDYIVVDECHHALAKTWRSVLDHFCTAHVLGVTATPMRMDGQALGDLFETVAYRYELRDAIRDGWLAPISARRIVVDSINLSRIATRAGDLAQDELAKVMEQAQAVEGVVIPLLEQARDRRTLVFAASVAHAHAIAHAINKRHENYVAAVAHGAMTDEQRKDMLARFRSGKLQFLVNVMLYTEGFDEPSVSCIAMCRPTKSWGLYMQVVGRGTRLCPGKHDMLLLDFSGQAGKHRLIGPIDCLVGHGAEIDDSVRATFDREMSAAQLDLEAVVADLEKRLSIHADEVIVQYHAEEIDPYLGDQDCDAATSIAMDPAWATQPVMAKQLSWLKKHGVAVAQLPPSFSRADAERLLYRLADRDRRGLCSLKQAKRIALSGIDTRTLTRARADVLIHKLRTHHPPWVPYALANEPEAIAGRIAKQQRRTA
jgi:superfamily II DNA or RNA helicase